MAEGWLAVAAAESVDLGGQLRSGWWLLGPVDARAVDRLDDGRGAEGLEDRATLTPGELAQEAALRKLARDCIGGTANLLAVAAASGISGGGSIRRSWSIIPQGRPDR